LLRAAHAGGSVLEEWGVPRVVRVWRRAVEQYNERTRRGLEIEVDDGAPVEDLQTANEALAVQIEADAGAALGKSIG
jgi:hypothetical protein